MAEIVHVEFPVPERPAAYWADETRRSLIDWEAAHAAHRRQENRDAILIAVAVALSTFGLFLIGRGMTGRA